MFRVEPISSRKVLDRCWVCDILTQLERVDNPIMVIGSVGTHIALLNVGATLWLPRGIPTGVYVYTQPRLHLVARLVESAPPPPPVETPVLEQDTIVPAMIPYGGARIVMQPPLTWEKYERLLQELNEYVVVPAGARYQGGRVAFRIGDMEAIVTIHRFHRLEFQLDQLQDNLQALGLISHPIRAPILSARIPAGALRDDSDIYRISMLELDRYLDSTWQPLPGVKFTYQISYGGKLVLSKHIGQRSEMRLYLLPFETYGGPYVKGDLMEIPIGTLLLGIEYSGKLLIPRAWDTSGHVMTLLNILAELARRG